MIESLPKFITEKGKLLEDVGIRAGKVEVELVLCHVLKVERLELYLHGRELLTDVHLRQFEEILTRRLTRYPIQYILGEAWFYGRTFVVNEAVMVPTPETEMLCEAAIRYVNSANLACPRILDVGVGSGVITVTMANELPDCRIVALDISPTALAVATTNAQRLGHAERIEFRQSDFFSSVKPEERFDLILSNPPYISESEYVELPPEVLADPKVSLVAGEQGMDAIVALVAKAPEFLAPGGRVMFEIGYNQADLVSELTSRDPRYSSIVIMRDLNDIDRVVILSCT